jgi:uncharacterized membrane protein YkvA (DUF1232 family)
MATRQPPDPAGGDPLNAGLRILRHLPNFIRLYWRLFRDPRVSPWPKAALVVALIYAVVPFDLLPDVLPGIGQLDDFVILLLACRVFVYLCPAEVVREHVRRIDAGTAPPPPPEASE